ncbi:MAG: excinuclease ABC subunit UvrA [Planctomycetes bacterium]|nr:excinuclease ABC subunit UvrA [Planctomycetota bacterium]
MNTLSIHGAGEHNLKNISLEVPRCRLTVFTGVSGSGKSSLVFDTIYREGQRRYLESLPGYARRFLGAFERPRIDRLEGLSPAIAIEARTAGRSPRSTVGTVTEIHDHLRLLFARLGTPHCPSCRRAVQSQTADQICGQILAQCSGKNAWLCAPVVRRQRGEHRRILEELKQAGFVRLRIDGGLARLAAARPGEEVPLPALPRRQAHTLEIVFDRLEIGHRSRSRLAEGVERCLALASGLVNVVVEGEEPEERLFNQKLACPRCGLNLPVIEPRLFSFNSPAGACPKCGGLGAVSEAVCSACGGRRLRPEALSVLIGGRAIADLSALTVEALRQFLRGLAFEGTRAQIGQPILKELDARLGFLTEVGLPYLSLDRRASTLAGGELQRVRLASQVGSGLQGLVVVLDEPSIGLHPRDHGRLLDALRRLRDRGNTVLVVEHDRAFMEAADHLVDLGPGAGREGGQVVAQGSLADLAAESRSITGAYLAGRRQVPIPETRRPPGEKWLEVRGARLHNLKGLDVRIPLGLLVAVTGVSGSGKSTLVAEVLKPALEARRRGGRKTLAGCRDLRGGEWIDQVVEVDQNPIGRSSRSCAATSTGILEAIRPLFARAPLALARGYGAGRFSFNADPGRCFNCKGAGRLEVEMELLPPVEIPCEECQGKRFNRETLEVLYRGRSIAEVLGLTVEEARDFFHDQPGIAKILERLQQLGLGYLQLGQPASALSGGEAQRLRLARELERPDGGRTLYLLDEPTTGLHFDDLARLLAALQELVNRGSTVLVVEHNLEMVQAADWVIDLGPESGEAGGEVVAEGPPEQIAAAPRSHTGRALAEAARRRLAGAAREKAGPAARPAEGEKEVPGRDLQVWGAAQHNLKFIDIRIPRDRLTVITGVSGSGKSSLAIDTLFAEGRRQFLESLSIYARQLVGKISPARVERLEGLMPAIAIDQKGASRHPHSTVATWSEVYDYLRLLFAKAGEPHCPACGAALQSATSSRLAAELVEALAGKRGYILAPLLPGLDRLKESLNRAAAAQEGIGHPENQLLDRFIDHHLQQGYTRFHIGGEEMRFEAGSSAALLALRRLLAKSPGPAPALEEAGVVIDRVVFEEAERSRIAGSLERAFEQGGGWALVRTEDGAASRHSQWPACPLGHFALKEELAPRLFSFSSLLGACPACHGTGLEEENPCALCRGARLRPESLRVRVGGRNIAEVAALTVEEAVRFFDRLEIGGQRGAIASPLLREIRQRLSFLRTVGLGYLQLERRSSTLSGGEAQRLRLASQLGNRLVGVLYVLDEPTIGLHPRDTGRLIATLKELRDLGNTLAVVEHDREVLAQADWLIELGPGAGPRGGELVAAGPLAEVLRSPASLTAKYLRGELQVGPLDKPPRPGRGHLIVHGARSHNLKGLEARFPLGALVAVTGVSGSGKSTLVLDLLAEWLRRRLKKERSGSFHPQLEARRLGCDGVSGAGAVKRLVVVDPMPLGRTPRSCPATYTGIWDLVRAFYASLPAARVKGFGAERFSTNRAGGRCESCKGEGALEVEMRFLADVRVTCDACRGERFDQETLAVRYKGLSAGDLLRLEIDRALEIFENHPGIRARLEVLREVGLGYLQLGQPASTLSGGEAQRVKLAAELARRQTDGALYILDEPTTGLHFEDVKKLLLLLDRLVEGGSTAIVIEHHLEVIAASDWVIDLGPEGGEAGGRIVAEGTPAEVARCEASHTGQALRKLRDGRGH